MNTLQVASTDILRGRRLVLIVVGLALLAVSLSAPAGTLPAQPKLFDAAYAAPTGHAISVNAGGDLQAALNQAQFGDTIVLQAGAHFTGPYSLPNKTGSGWIYVQSSNYAKLPISGTRIRPSDAVNMPVLVAPASGSAIVSDQGSHHFRFVGIEFKTAPDVYTTNVVQLDNSDKSTATLSHHITFDRCYFYADTSVGARRGLLGNAAYLAVVDSYFDGFREHGADSQAIIVFNTSGPIKLVNNYFSGAGENVLFGGADSADVSLIPSDIEIRGNQFFKPLSWRGSSWVVKNLLEFKSAKRVLVTGNIFENIWAAGQSGFALLITPRNQDGKAPWSTTEDLTLSNNRFTNVGSGINILATDNLHPSQNTTRVLIQNNLIQATGLSGAHGWAFMLLEGPPDVTIEHNTILSTTAFMEAEKAPSSPLADGLVFENNIAVSTAGLIGGGTSSALDTLRTYFSNWTMKDNAFTGGTAAAYPPGNLFPTNESDIHFVNASGGDYSLAVGSPFRGAGSDGKDLGADMALVPGAAGVATGIPAFKTAVPDAPQALQVH
jgi:hypothetical protein